MSQTKNTAGRNSLILFAVFAVIVMVLGVISFLTACPNFTNAECSPSSPNPYGLMVTILGAIMCLPTLTGSVIYGAIYLKNRAK